MLGIQSSDREKQTYGSSEQPESSIRPPIRRRILIGAFSIVGTLVLADRFHFKDLRAEERAANREAIDASTQSLRDRIKALELDDTFTITVVDGVDWPGNTEAEIKIEHGNCSAEIPMRETSRQYSDDERIPFVWDRAEDGGKENLLAIPDEFGKVIGYLPLSAENIQASFPAECTE